MALQVWLPLNGNLNNQGLCFCNFTTATATINNSGKIGKCYNFTQNSGNGIYLASGISCADFMNKYINNHSWTLCAWVKTSSSSTPVMYLTYGLGFLVGSSTSISLSNSSRTVSCSTSTPSNGNIWHHVAASYNVIDNKISIYVDGILKNTNTYTSGYTYSSSWTNGIFIGRNPNNNTANDSYFYKGDVNDVRIYDHCLSPKEVKEISKGLVLHYKLDDQYSESTTNIVRYPTQGSSVGSIGWDVSKHQNAIYVSNWGVGYNSGVSTPAQGYHACWKIIDGLPTMVMVDRNSVIGLSHRWLGISGGISGTMIPSNTIYTVSFDAMSDVQNKQMSSGVYYRQSSSGSYGFHDGCPVFTLSTNWKRYSYTYTIKTVNNISSLYFYGHNGSLEGTVYIRNIQVELKNYATPYVNGTRTAIIIYDSSGYQNNGTITGNLTLNSDTARYNYSSLFNAIATNYISIPYQGLQGSYNNKVWTISFWINTQQQGNRHMIVGTVGNYNTNIELSTSNTLRIYWAGTPDWSPGISCPTNTWVHIAIVITSTYIKAYKDGVLIGTNSTAPNWAGCTSNLLIGSDQRIGTYFLGAKLSDFRIYATALSDIDIKELYDTPANIDNFGNMFTFEYDELNINLLLLEEYGIFKQQWLNGLSSYTQANCSVTLTSNGYRIYRPANVNNSSSGGSNNMWGGFILKNINNRYGFTKGHTYIIQFEVTGKSSNAVSDIYWTNQVGWGGGGLNPAPTNVVTVNPVTSNFDTTEWKTFIYKWTISDDVYKVCTSSYSSFIQGDTYISYRDFKFGFGYTNTGTLGTDIYIRNLRMYDITSNKKIDILKRGILESNTIVEENIPNAKFIMDSIIETKQLIEK